MNIYTSYTVLINTDGYTTSYIFKQLYIIYNINKHGFMYYKVYI